MKFIQSQVCALVLVTLAVFQLSAQRKAMPVIYQGDATWAKAKLNQMSLDEKMGQLFMVAAYSNKGAAHEKEILNLVKQENIGGLIFFQGGPVRQARLTNSYQSAATTPLMIAMDAEWGLSMRLDSTFKFPWPMTVGATNDSLLAYQMGFEIAKHCRRLGVHVNFGPVVDINTNPNNPIINARSFGEDPEMVAKLGAAYMKGMQDAKVLANAKHFPGHGDTDSDSHKTLPTVGHAMDRLREIELSPYQRLIDNGLGSVMVAHLNVPSMDSSGTPSSLSNKIINGYLRDTLGFKGLVFTDALNMRGVADLYPPGEVDVKALLAGNDVLLFSQDVPTAKKKIKEAIIAGKLTEADIDERVLRILLAKSWLGIEQKKYVEPKNIVSDLSPKSSQMVNKHIYESAITVVRNKQKLVPIQDLKNKKIACVVAGTNIGTTYYNTLRKYANVELFTFNGSNGNELLNKLSSFDLVIAGCYTSNASPWKSYKYPTELKSFIRRLGLQNKTIVSLFANAYTLQTFPEAASSEALLIAYQNHPEAERAAAQIIFGARASSGRLPVSAGPSFEAGFGYDTPSLNRLGYAMPAEMGMDSEVLSEIDDIVNEAMRQGATPGCQVLIARRGKIVFEKNYGYMSYQKKTKVESHHLYDIASITKIAATLPLLMRLVEQDKIDLDQRLGYYLPKLRGTNKDSLIIRDVLTHQARLTPWIPFYLETLEEGKQKPAYFAHNRSFKYPNTVAKDLYSSRTVKDTIMDRILRSKLRNSKDYKYSDLGYYLLADLVEKMEGKSMEKLTNDWLYSSLGAATLGYHPLKRFDENQIIPTENDKSFRQQQIRGYVHDQGAALMGGVAGHAGLFSNANDLAKLIQMYLNGGEYGGVSYLDSITLKEFTRCQFCETDNRRGIGFDKPQIEGPGPTCGCVSPRSYGHTGFTGTLAWADPSEEIVYIFLSNRINPSAENRKLLTLSTRTRIQEVIYNSLQNENEITSNSTAITQLKP